jgi:hypothetical protein
MISDDIVEAFNNRLTANLTNIKSMTPSQLDRVKSIGSAAENLLKNREFILFVRQFQIETADALTDIRTHTQDDNATRVALANQLNGMDTFIGLLKRQVMLKNRVVTQQTEPNTEQ